jgi:succinoglycan biosynthesis protein ExoA
MGDQYNSSDANSGSRRTTLPLVSVLMPVRDEAAFVERSVGSALTQDYPHDRMEILIADGGSTDATREVIERLGHSHPDISIKLLDNPGKIVATGLNAALKLAKGEVIVRVDGHCEIAPDYVSRCVRHLLNDGVEAVGGRVETIGESYTARAIAVAMSSWFGVGGSAFRVANGSSQFTDTVAFPAYTRAVIDRAGLFDEELVRNQDDEYNYRLRKLGVRLLLASDVRSRYYSRGTLPGLASQYFQYGYWKVRVMQKHPRQMRLRQFAPPLFVAVLLAVLLALPITPVAKYLALTIAGVYALGVIGASILAAQKSEWQSLPLLPIAFVILHLAYGFGFLFGLVKFWNRWGDRQSKWQSQAAISDVDKYEHV